MIRSYTEEAQIHGLSLLANAAYDLQEPDFQQLQQLTTLVVKHTLGSAEVQKCIGTDWQLLWGPVVYSNNTHAARVVADNTMMLLYSKLQNLFVIGIAGTNKVSMYGWMQEDFQVNALVNWSGIVKKTIIEIPEPAVSAGSYTGLQLLLSMQDGGQTMLESLSSFLSTYRLPAGAKLAVAGHSLGGALAPVMAMYLQDVQSIWNHDLQVVTISAWPTAGPTPGNAAFARYVAANLPAYTSRYNPLDVVPHAWQKDSLEAIPLIYKQAGLNPPESTAPFETFIGTLVTAVFLKTINKADKLPIDYQQIQPWNRLEGSAFDKLTNDKAIAEMLLVKVYEPEGLKQYMPYLTNLFCFLMQMAYQHTTAYNTLLGIEEFAEEYKRIKEKVTGKTDDERNYEALHAALKRYYGFGGLPVFTKKPASAPEAITI